MGVFLFFSFKFFYSKYNIQTLFCHFFERQNCWWFIYPYAFIFSQFYIISKCIKNFQVNSRWQVLESFFVCVCVCVFVWICSTCFLESCFMLKSINTSAQVRVCLNSWFIPKEPVSYRAECLPASPSLLLFFCAMDQFHRKKLLLWAS